MNEQTTPSRAPGHDDAGTQTDQPPPPPPPPPSAQPLAPPRPPAPRGTHEPQPAGPPRPPRPPMFSTIERLSSSRSPRAAVALLAVGAAVFLDLAVRGELASLAGLLAVMATAATVWTASSSRSNARVIALCLAVLVGSNLVLRTSNWVTIPSVIAAVSLLVIAADDRLLRLSARGTWTMMIRVVTRASKQSRS